MLVTNSNNAAANKNMKTQDITIYVVSAIWVTLPSGNNAPTQAQCTPITVRARSVSAAMDKAQAQWEASNNDAKRTVWATCETEEKTRHMLTPEYTQVIQNALVELPTPAELVERIKDMDVMQAQLILNKLCTLCACVSVAVDTKRSNS